MIMTETWLKIVCSMLINTVLFGFGMIVVLTVPFLASHAKYAIPAVVAMSFVLAPLAACLVAPRMRIRTWGRENWRKGDLISG